MVEIGIEEAGDSLSALLEILKTQKEIRLTGPDGQAVAEIVLPWGMNGARADAAETVERMRQLAKQHPLGSFEDVMAWRREGLPQ